MIEIYLPKFEDLWFREKFLEDYETMSFNHHWGGTINWPKEKWKKWYQVWIENNEGKRFYRYLVNENGDFVGEIAYHLDESINKYLANVIVYAPYRKHGYGKAGLIKLCEIAKSHGVDVLYDDIAIDNPSIEMFKKYDFVEEYRTNEIVMLKKVLK